MLYVLIAGGPCTGKTTLTKFLASTLKSRGLRVYVIRDWAREIIREGKEGSNVPLPWTDRVEFEIEVVRRHLRDFRKGLRSHPDIIIEDSGSIAPIAYCRVDGTSLPSEVIEEILSHAKYLDLVLITEPVGDYNTDMERWEEKEYAVRIHREIVRVHKEVVAKYTSAKLVKLRPTRDPSERALIALNHVLSLLKQREPA